MILCCPRCNFIREWDKTSSEEPGKCSCGAYAPWRVLNKMPEKGFVIVMSSEGQQELSAKFNWQEHPDAWIKDE